MFIQVCTNKQAAIKWAIKSNTYSPKSLEVGFILFLL